MGKKFNMGDSAILGSLTKPQEEQAPAEVQPKPETETQPVKEVAQEGRTITITVPTGKQEPPEHETKSKRLQLVLTPRLHKTLKKYCEDHKISVNDFVCRTLEEILKEE